MALREVSGLGGGIRARSCGVLWTCDGTLSFTVSLVRVIGGMHVDSGFNRLRLLWRVAFCKAAEAKACKWNSCNYLAFCSRFLSGVLSLHSLENTVTHSDIRDHPLPPQ